MVNTVTITLPRTPDNKLNTTDIAIQTENAEPADYCMFLNPLVAILNDIRLTGFKGA